MAEEHGFQASEGHRLCVNNCGFFGSPATQNMCSKCYRDLCLNNSADSSHFSPSLTLALSSSAPPAPAVLVSSAEKAESPIETVAQPATANRCSACRKKVGLTGFRCKCGFTFCGTHRYSEKHGCTFDFKAAGREAIAKANPLVKGQKLQKIWCDPSRSIWLTFLDHDYDRWRLMVRRLRRSHPSTFLLLETKTCEFHVYIIFLLLIWSTIFSTNNMIYMIICNIPKKIIVFEIFRWFIA